jgi:cellobiose-specific phosphotransferase system component IIC
MVNDDARRFTRDLARRYDVVRHSAGIASLVLATLWGAISVAGLADGRERGLEVAGELDALAIGTTASLALVWIIMWAARTNRTIIVRVEVPAAVERAMAEIVPALVEQMTTVGEQIRQNGMTDIRKYLNEEITIPFIRIEESNRTALVEQVRGMLRDELREPLADLVDQAMRAGLVTKASTTPYILNDGASVLRLARDSLQKES